MAKIINFPTISYFGGCPKCGGNDGYLNVRSAHFCVCDRHGLWWHIGEDLFGDWKEENEAIWEQNLDKLGCFKQVNPIYSAYCICCLYKYGFPENTRPPNIFKLAGDNNTRNTNGQSYWE
jgi:hypothetical protein